MPQLHGARSPDRPFSGEAPRQRAIPKSRTAPSPCKPGPRSPTDVPVVPKKSARPLPKVTQGRPASTQPRPLVRPTPSPHLRPATSAGINISNRGRALALRRAAQRYATGRFTCMSSSSASSSEAPQEEASDKGIDMSVAWEQQARGRHILKPSNKVGALNDAVEAMHETVNRKTRSMINERDCSPDIALQELAVGIETLDTNIRSVHESSRQFGAAAIEDFLDTSSEVPEVEDRGANKLKAIAGREGDKRDSWQEDDEEAAIENELLKEFQEHLALNDSSKNTRNLLHGGGGPMLRAWAALEKCDIGTNVHEVGEVKAIANGCDRVDTKLWYYKDNIFAAVPLLQNVERGFMHVDARSGERLVDITLLRALHRKPGGEPVRIGMRTPTPPPLSSTAVERSRSIQERASEHAARVEKAVVSARELDMNRRVTHLQKFRHKMVRADEAARMRPWLTSVCIALAAVVMQKVFEAYRAEVAALETFDQQRVAKKEGKGTGVSLWRDVQRRFRSPREHIAAKGFTLSKAQLQTIHRFVLQRRLRSVEIRHRSRIYKSWMVLLRCAIFVIKLKRPLKRHKMMDFIKDFIHSSWRGMRLRVTIKSYAKKMKLLQKMFRHTHDIMEVLKKQVFLPQIWVMESWLLGTAVGLREDLIQQEIADFLQLHDTEPWKMRLHNLFAVRHRVLKSAMTTRENHMDNIQAEIELASMQYQKSGAHKHGFPGGRQVSAESSAWRQGKSRRPSLLHTPRPSPGPSPRPSPRNSFDALTMMSATNTNTLKPEAHHAPHSRHHASSPPLADILREYATGRMHDAPMGMVRMRRQRPERREKVDDHESQRNILDHMEDLRLTEEERDTIASIFYRDNVDRWWQQYRAYKAACLWFEPVWKKWKREVTTLGVENQHLWPEQPECPKYPQEMLKMHLGSLKYHVTSFLRQGRAASLFTIH